MLQIFAIIKLRIAIDASPAPRKIPLIRNSSIITRLPAIVMRVKVEPMAIVSSSAPIKRRISSAKTNPDGSEVPSWLSNPMSTLPLHGYIGFQGKHAGAPIYFRNIKIKKLK